MLGEQYILAVVVHLRGLMLSQAVKRLVGIRIEYLLNGVVAPCPDLFRTEDTPITLGQEHVPLAVEKAHHTRVECDIRSEVARAKLQLSAQPLHRKGHLAGRRCGDHETRRDIQGLRGCRRNPNDAIRHELQPYPFGRALAGRDDNSIGSLLIRPGGTCAGGEKQERNNTTGQKRTADQGFQWVFLTQYSARRTRNT